MSEPQYEEQPTLPGLEQQDPIQGLKDVQSNHEGKERCPECHHYFSPGSGIRRHREAMHGVVAPPAPDQVQCPACSKWYSDKWIGQHMRKIHGLSRNGQPVKRRGRPPGVKNKPRETQPVPSQRERYITSEGMTTALATMVWPEGVPPSKLEALLRWNTATAAFLTEVQD